MKINVTTSVDIPEEELQTSMDKVSRINNIIKTCFNNEFVGMKNIDCINILMTCTCTSLFNILFSIVDEDMDSLEEFIKTFVNSLPEILQEYKERVKENNKVH